MASTKRIDRMNRRGQALIEFAVMGSIALLALTMLIQLGLRMNYQQEMQQDAFRRALTIAKSEDEEESQAVQYNFFRNRRLPNPAEGFGVTPRILTQGSGSVTWGEWLTFLDSSRDSQPRIVVNLDDEAIQEYRAEDIPADQPLVSKISKDLQGSGTITQNPNSSQLNSNSSEATTMELSTGATLSSTANTSINYNW